MHTAELVVSPEERRLIPGRRWRGDAQAEAELNMVIAPRREAWKNQKIVTQDNQMKRAVRRADANVERGCDNTYARFLEKHV